MQVRHLYGTTTLIVEITLDMLFEHIRVDFNGFSIDIYEVKKPYKWLPIHTYKLKHSFNTGGMKTTINYIQKITP